MNQKIPQYEDILSAHQRIKNYIHQTPVLQSDGINKILDCDLFFKCENFQKVGAFKFRGACNAVFSLSDDQAKNGVATHSSGNHAAALALAAKLRGIKAYVVMPETSSKIKIIAVTGYGAEITYCKPTLEARESTLDKVVKETNAQFIHPYDNFQVICGQGTASKEFLEEIPDLDYVVTPVGGGGLLSGTAITVRALSPNTKVIAAEPKNANDAWRSFKSGKLVPSINPDTIADGLLTSLSPLTFKIIQEKVDDIITVMEDTIIRAMRMIWERMKIIIEPSSAVTLAIVIENLDQFKGKRVGLILTGGNVDLENLPF
ncbi:MAG: pyridoxal-phosphate dependent enzyme [Bacteroidetes bacterium]|nr:pyridoxal-phosphate dependent enzyme [Bacteroidota bacterium]